MFCPNCGTQNPDGSRFCAECGTLFNAEASETPVVTEEAQTAEKPIPEQTVDQIIEEIAPKQTGEKSVPEQTVDQIINEIIPEKPAEQPIPEAPAEQPIPEAPVEQPIPEAPVEQPIPEAPVEQPIPEAPVEQPIPEAPVEQSIPEQPMPQYQQPVPQYQQPMPQYQQPPYASPYPQQPAAPRPPKPPRKPMDPKTKKKVIIGGSCGAVLVAFLIVLFTAIIPNSGLKGKLRHVWTRSDSSRTYVMDLKSKKLTIGSQTNPIQSWKASGDRLEITYIESYGPETERYVVAFSPDGKKLYLFGEYRYKDGDRPDMVFVRKGSNNSNNINNFDYWDF